MFFKQNFVYHTERDEIPIVFLFETDIAFLPFSVV